MSANQTSIVYSKGTSVCAGSVTGKALTEKKSDYQHFLCDFFFGDGYCNKEVNANALSGSLYRRWCSNKNVFFKKIIVAEHADKAAYKAQTEQGNFYLFLFLDFCFDYNSLKQLLNIITNYYSTLHLQDSIAHNILHTKIWKSDIVFKDACDVIVNLQMLAKDDAVINSIFLKYSTQIILDVSRKGTFNKASFKKRVSALSGPYFWFFVVSLIEHIGLFPDLEGYTWKFSKDYPEEPPQQFNSFKVIKYVFANDEALAKALFKETFEENFYEKLIQQKLPSTYEEFINQDLDEVVEDWFDKLTDSKSLDFFFDYYNIIAPNKKKDKSGEPISDDEDTSSSNSTIVSKPQTATKRRTTSAKRKCSFSTKHTDSSPQKMSKVVTTMSTIKRVEIKKQLDATNQICEGCYRSCSRVGSHLQLFNTPAYAVKLTYFSRGELKEEIYFNCLRHVQEDINFFNSNSGIYELNAIPQEVLHDVQQMGKHVNAESSVDSRRKREQRNANRSSQQNLGKLKIH